MMMTATAKCDAACFSSAGIRFAIKDQPCSAILVLLLIKAAAREEFTHFCIQNL